VFPNASGGFADPRFYNGLASIIIANFGTLSNTQPSQTINQTISFSDFVSWRHKKHNMRYGLDMRRVHNDSIGGNNPLGSFSLRAMRPSSPTSRRRATGGRPAAATGFADFLLGLPQSTAIQAGLYKIYLRENVYRLVCAGRLSRGPSVTLNYGLRYEYFGPYTEKNNRLVNLTGINGAAPVTTGGW
jgi:hypothetical protein